VGNEIYLVRWKDGSFSFLFDQSQETLFLALDPIGEPSDAEVRLLPPDLMSGVFFDQEKEFGHFSGSALKSNTRYGENAPSSFGLWNHLAPEKWGATGGCLSERSRVVF
jgi:hypothetical protein